MRPAGPPTVVSTGRLDAAAGPRRAGRRTAAHALAAHLSTGRGDGDRHGSGSWGSCRLRLTRGKWLVRLQTAALEGHAAALAKSRGLSAWPGRDARWIPRGKPQAAPEVRLQGR